MNTQIIFTIKKILNTFIFYNLFFKTEYEKISQALVMASDAASSGQQRPRGTPGVPQGCGRAPAPDTSLWKRCGAGQTRRGDVQSMSMSPSGVRLWWSGEDFEPGKTRLGG